MRLAQKATGLLMGLKPKQTGDRRADGFEKDNAKPLSANVKGRGAESKRKETSRYPRRPADKVIATGTATASALGKRRRNMGQPAISIHEDAQDTNLQSRRLRKMSAHDRVQDDQSMVDESMSDGTDTDDEPDESVMEDMRKLEESFAGISQKYRLINRIGEGTFSTVYKAEQLPQDETEDVENEHFDDISQVAPPSKRRKLASSSQTLHRGPKRNHPFVALKKIYVTSSPHRILNELELLHELRHSDYICPLLTAFRHLDQVVAVLPFFKHLDFRLYYRNFLINDMRHYFRSLFNGLAHVHKAGILHRDIKPTNFLYDHDKRQGVLVDFGLAEKQGTDWQPCLCIEPKDKRKERFLNSYAVKTLENLPDLRSTGYPKQDTRPSRRANRAGTRGFRAPEVLFKCTSQTTKIDIWSAGVILLTLLARRFPFFNSADDVDAMIEMASVFGKKRMQMVAAMHGQLFETNIETIGERGFTLEKIVLWASCREKDDDGLRAGEEQAIALLNGLLELDPLKRLSAKEALQHEFFTAPVEDEREREDREAQEAEEREAKRRH